jgi:pimeloyl-ACP methyl ester carboxylesterase
VPLPPGLSNAALNVIYLHGFASSARSTKAAYLADRLGAHAATLRCPDFNEPDFASMTLTRMLDQVAREVDGCSGPVKLIGSSLGGTVAILSAARLRSQVDRVVLFAPAVMFAKPGHHLLPPERIDAWRRRGAMPFFHYAHNEERPLDFTFYEDSQRYDAFVATFRQPALIFQGLRDASVDHRTVEEFARTRPNVTLSLLDDDHQLIASLPRIWSDVAAFLGLVE